MTKITTTEQVGNSLELTVPAQRIVSLVPSQTELLYYLGLEEKVMGITKFCVHPAEWFRTKQRVGGTKTINIEKIKQLQPDLVLANKEENVQDQVEVIAAFAPVWASDVNTLKDATAMITSVGELTGTKTKATELAGSIIGLFDDLLNTWSVPNENATSPDASENPPHAAAYFIWKDPYMVAGGGTFISDMMKYCGFRNVYENRSRYPQIDPAELNALDCNLVLLSSEPYPFKEKHIAELEKRFPGKLILLVDGEMFSWYGSRLLLAAPYFSTLREQVAKKLNLLL
jgi:ABC-type Fe3+-hydroxamate transport system substrate-binding protein